MTSVIIPSPASTRFCMPSGSRGPTVVPIAVPTSTVPTLMRVPTMGGGENGRRCRAPTSCSSPSAAPPGCARPTPSWPRRCGAPGAAVAVAAAQPPREWRTYALLELAWARAARRGAAAAIREHRPRRGALLEHHGGTARPGPRRDPLRRPGGGQPAGPPRDLAAPARAPPLRRRAAARAVERGRSGRGAATARRGGGRAGAGRAERPAGGRARHRRRHVRRQPATRRASTACSPRGRPRRARTRRSSSPGSTPAPGGARSTGGRRCACASPACSRRTSTAHCCAARASS